KPGSLAPNLGDHGPSDSALAASRAWRLRQPAADRHAARCASRDLCSGARPSAPCALVGELLFQQSPKVGSAPSRVPSATRSFGGRGILPIGSVGMLIPVSHYMSFYGRALAPLW